MNGYSKLAAAVEEREQVNALIGRLESGVPPTIADGVQAAQLLRAAVVALTERQDWRPARVSS